MTTFQKIFNATVFVVFAFILIGGFIWYRHDSEVLQDGHDISGAVSSSGMANQSPTTVPVKLSHHDISMNSPWGAEMSYKGGKGIGQYTFASGAKMAVLVYKNGPREQIEQDTSLTASEKESYEPLFQLLSSKFGHDFTSYEFLRLVMETKQKDIDDATSTMARQGYAKALELKPDLLFGSDSPFKFANRSGGGFIYMTKDYSVPIGLDYFDKNDDRFTFMFPRMKEITKPDIEIMMNSVTGL